VSQWDSDGPMKQDTHVGKAFLIAAEVSENRSKIEMELTK
jgi:hypothetical protein